MVSAVEGQAPIRVLLAIGDAERERRLLEGLSGDGLVVAARCLDGPSLAERAAAHDVDVALVSTELHRLTPASLIAVQEARLPLVLTADAAEAPRYRGLAHLLPRTAGPLEISQALQAAVRSGPSYAPVSPRLPSAPDSGSADREGAGEESGGHAGRVIAVLSGKGAPGATTVAIALAAALAECGRRTALLDADLSGGNVGAYLDLDPRRGLFALAYGREVGQQAWERRVEEELQDGPGFLVLNGIERAEQRSTVSVDVLTTALAALRSFEDVVVDAGAVIPGLASGATDALLRAADRLLLVANGDVVALWNAQAALRHVLDGLAVSPEAVGIAVNRRNGREHYDAAEVERALRVPVLAAVAEDRKAARRAIAQQLPLTSVGGRAARALRRLAAALTAAEPVGAAAPGAARRRWLPAWRRA